jgi:hypothetical protein
MLCDCVTRGCGVVYSTYTKVQFYFLQNSAAGKISIFFSPKFSCVPRLTRKVGNQVRHHLLAPHHLHHLLAALLCITCSPACLITVHHLLACPHCLCLTVHHLLACPHCLCLTVHHLLACPHRLPAEPASRPKHLNCSPMPGALLPAR